MGKEEAKRIKEQSMRFTVSRVEFVVFTTRVGKENIIDGILAETQSGFLPKASSFRTVFTGLALVL